MSSLKIECPVIVIASNRQHKPNRGRALANRVHEKNSLALNRYLFIICALNPRGVSILRSEKPQMNTDEHKSETDRVTERIIGCAFTVGNRLGCGFLEKVYENALVIELSKAGLRVTQQQPMEVRYDEVVVGTYVADVVVEDSVLLEIKAVKLFDEIHTAQCLNYLKATGLPICLLINFGRPRVDIKRVILTTDTSR